MLMMFGDGPWVLGKLFAGLYSSLKRNFILKKGIKALIRGRSPSVVWSSSAAVMTAYLMALCDVNNIQLSDTELIDYSHWVENNFYRFEQWHLGPSC